MTDTDLKLKRYAQSSGMAAWCRRMNTRLRRNHRAYLQWRLRPTIQPRWNHPMSYWMDMQIIHIRGTRL